METNIKYLLQQEILLFPWILLDILNLYSTPYGGQMSMDDEGINFNLPRDILKQVKALEKSILIEKKKTKQIQQEEIEMF